MFWPRGGCLVYNLISFFSLSIIFPNFFHGISYVIWITLSFNCRYPSMCVHTSHRPYGYSLLMLCSWQQTHWNPWCNLRHLYCNCTRYWLPCGMKTITCTSFIHIVFTKDGICTLGNVVIANPTWGDLFPRFCTIQGFVTINAVQAKEKNYCNWHPIDQFLPLANEVFGYLHKHVNVLLHNCANVIWSLKRPKGLHFPTLVIFLCQKNSITLQRMQASSIFSWTINVCLTTSWFPPLQDTPSITTNNLLHAVDFWHGQIWLTYYR
jgi:hypothetical protein